MKIHKQCGVCRSDNLFFTYRNSTVFEDPSKPTAYNP